MPPIDLPQPIAAVSGSVGGTTYSRNAAGPYQRDRVTPTDPATSFQLAVRNAMGLASFVWNVQAPFGVHPPWHDYATNVPLRNALGRQHRISGRQMFLRTNVPRGAAAVGFRVNAPTIFNLGQFTPPPFFVIEGSSLVVSFDPSDDWVNETGSFMLVYGSRTFFTTTNYHKGPYRFALAIPGDSITPPTSPFTGTWPFFVRPGRRVFVRITVARNDARLSSVYRSATIVDPL